jgi:hypothetical protein
MDGTLFFLFINFIYGWITRTLKWTRTQLFLNSVFRERQHVNAWNAFLKEKLREANSGHGCYARRTKMSRGTIRLKGGAHKETLRPC